VHIKRFGLLHICDIQYILRQNTIYFLRENIIFMFFLAVKDNAFLWQETKENWCALPYLTVTSSNLTAKKTKYIAFHFIRYATMVTPNKDNIFYSTLALFGVTVVVYFMKMLSGSRNHLIRMYWISQICKIPNRRMCTKSLTWEHNIYGQIYLLILWKTLGNFRIWGMLSIFSWSVLTIQW
jgi:hypothetical protein